MSHNNPSEGELWYPSPPSTATTSSGPRTLNHNPSSVTASHSKKSYDHNIAAIKQSTMWETNCVMMPRVAPRFSFRAAASSHEGSPPVAGLSAQDSIGNPRQTGTRRQELAGNSTQSEKMVVNSFSGYGSSIQGMGIPISNLMDADALQKNYALQHQQEAANARKLHDAYRREYHASIPCYRQDTIATSTMEAYTGSNYTHQDNYNMDVMARRPTQWASMMPPERETRPSQLFNPAGYLPRHSVDSPQYTFVPPAIQPNQQLCRIRNEMPPMIYQGQEQGQIYEDELKRMQHTNVGQSYNNCEDSSSQQQRLLEYSLPPPSQPQEPLPLLRRLSHNQTSGKRKGRKGICFEERLSSLIEFQSEYGHCNVPTCTRKKDQLNKYYTLGLWCGNVRKAYKMMQQNKKPAMRLADEHIQRLNEVGFRWQRKSARSPGNVNLE